MAKNQNTYAKRQREMEKKRKIEDKKVRRQRRKDEPEGTPDAEANELNENGEPADPTTTPE
jgi:hypothetical protein